MGDVAQADDRVVGVYAPAPFPQQVVVHLLGVPELPVPGRQHRAVREVQVRPDPGPFRRTADDRDPGETAAIAALTAAYQRTKNEATAQYRDGRCAVRDTWDEAVAHALGIDVETIFEYAELLASEPAVSHMTWRKMITELNGEDHS